MTLSAVTWYTGSPEVDMLCPHCGTEYDDSEPVCTSCGRSPYIPKHLRGKPPSTKEAGTPPQPKILKSKPAAPAPAEPESLPGEREAAGQSPSPSSDIPVEMDEKASGTWEKVASGAEDPAWAAAGVKEGARERVVAGDDAELAAGLQEPESADGNAPNDGADRDDAPVEEVHVQACGFWRRALALALDAPAVLAVAALISTAIYLLMAAAGGTTLSGLFPPAREHGIDYLVDLALVAPALLAPGMAGLVLSLVLYRCILKEQTLGRRILSMRVVNRSDAEPPGTARIAARALLLVLGTAALGMGPLWAGFHREKRALHDVLCGTMVIHSKA